MPPRGPGPGEADDPRAGRGRALRVLSMTLAVLAFMPLVPRVDPLEGGGTTLRGAIEVALLGGALLLASAAAPASRGTRVALASPALLTSLAFAAWAGLTALWSPNPVLTLAKSAELAMIACEAALVTRPPSSPGGRPGLADDLALALGGAILALFLFNCAAHGAPLPVKAGEGQVEALGASAEAKRPRLMLAYAHPLIAGDLIALSAVCVFVSSARPALKAALLGAAALLLVLTDARTAMAAAPTAVASVWVAAHFRRRPAAIALAACASALALLALALVFVNGGLPGGLQPDEELYTLNGRVELWEYLWPIFLENWKTGVGFYGSRYLLLDRWAWAGHTHHSVVEVAVCLGVVGLGLLGAIVATAVRAAFRTGDGLLVGVCAYTFIVGNINPILIDTSLPTFLFLLALFQVGLDGPATRGDGPAGSAVVQVLPRGDPLGPVEPPRSGRLPEDQGQVIRVQEQVAAPEAGRLSGEPEGPLQAGPLRPGRGLRHRPRVEVERRPHRDDRHRERVPVFIRPDLLAGAAQAHEDDLRPAGPDPTDHPALLLRRDPPEPGRLMAGDPEPWEPPAEVLPQGVEDLGPAPVQVDRRPRPGRPRAKVEGELRAVDPVGKARPVEEVQRPTHRLAVGHDQVEVVEPIPLRLVEHARHHPVDRQGRDGQGPAGRRRPQDRLDRRLVVDGVDQDPQHAPLAPVDQTPSSEFQRSTFASWISRRIAGTSYRCDQLG